MDGAEHHDPQRVGIGFGGSAQLGLCHGRHSFCDVTEMHG